MQWRNEDHGEYIVDTIQTNDEIKKSKDHN